MVFDVRVLVSWPDELVVAFREQCIAGCGDGVGDEMRKAKTR